MSIEAMSWALQQSCPSPTAKLVLIGLGNHAHADGTAAWPAIATLATYAGASERTVQRALRELEATGFISRSEFQPTHLPANRRTTAYDLPIRGEIRGDNLSPQESGVTPASPPGVTSGASRGDTAVSYEPSLNRPVEPSSTPSSPDGDQPPLLELVGESENDGFEELWEAYPRRRGRRAGSKSKARQRWKSMKRPQRLQVMQAVENYRRERAPSGNGEYVMDLARFLGTEWEAWVEPAVAMPVPSSKPLTQVEARLGEGWR